ADAARRADVVVVIVPLGLSDEHQPDYRALDAATAAVGRGLRAGTLVVYETTLPVGDTRGRFGPALERVSGLRLGDPERGFLLAFSPERVSSGRVFRDLASYPKLVGGVDTASTERAAAFYRSVLDAEVRTLSSSEVAEFTKLAETTYRDVNIALANELARASERAGVDILEVIEAANSQPYSHLHAPGLGVGGHCIPVYPHFLLDRAPDLELVRTARRINQDQVGWAVRRLQTRLGDLKGAKVLLLGLTYRDGVHELAHSRALPLIERLRVHGAQLHAFDPLLSEDEIQGCGAVPYRWGDELPARTIVTQTADPLWRTLDFGQFPELELVFDGRNSLRGIQLPAGVAYLGVGAPPIRATYSPGE
ncbi:MAG: nucleotide sugar dehydrogenase, partial [Chloroflexi bacterium]|nr:nucleotide sugar dehydrogenase [Chloroflexota bacterium]